METPGKVWIVTDEPDHDNSHIMGVFSTAEAADKFALGVVRDGPDVRDLAEAMVTEWDVAANRRVWRHSYYRTGPWRTGGLGTLLETISPTQKLWLYHPKKEGP